MSVPALTESAIAQLLIGVPNRGIFNPFPGDFFKEPPHKAAILISFTCIEREWHLLFIRRTQNEHDRHGGQVAFPGGRMDAADPHLVAAALREAEEEVGLKPRNVRILGQLHDFHSVTNYIVTPVVGTFDWPYHFQINRQEVSRVFTIPLAWLADANNYQVMRRHLPPSRPWPIIYYDPYDGEALWGFTAQIVVQLIEILRNSRP